MILLLGNCNHQFISGSVFFDENKNGIIDSDEKGIAGVMVYTKSSSTKTDKDGQYSLKVSPGESYVMILPDPEYSPPLDQYGQPVFYKKIKKAPSIVFPLEKREQNDSVLLVADPQVSNRQEIEYTEQSLRLILKKIERPGLMIFLGDLVMDDVSLFKPLKESFARLDVPWLTLYGNHDSKKETPIQDKLVAYEQSFGPTDYAWEIADTRILFINNVIWSEGNGYTGGLRSDQKELLSRLATTNPKPAGLLQLMHIPIQGNPKESEDTRTRDRKFLLNLGTQYDFEASVSGHSHIMYWSKIKPNHWHWNLGTLSGSWWSGQKTANGLPKAMMQDGTPPGAGYFTGWPLAQKAKYLPTKKQALLKVFKPAAFIPGSKWPYQKILLQWLGSPVAAIQYKINQSKWENVRKRSQYSPEYLKLYSDQFFKQKAALANPRKSHNIYEIRLKPQSEAVKQEIEIRVLLKNKVLAREKIIY